MANWTRRFLLIPHAEANPSAVVSCTETETNTVDEASPIVGQPQKDKRIRPYRDTTSRPIIGPGEKNFESPTAHGAVRPRMYGEPEAPAAGNLLVTDAGVPDSGRYSFNQASVERMNFEETTAPDIGTVTFFDAPGDTQYRQSPLTFGKAPDVLETSYFGLETALETQTTGEGSGDPSRYSFRPKLLPLSDGRLMCVWMSVYMPSVYWRWIGAGGILAQAASKINTRIRTAFLDPSTMLWSAPSDISQSEIPLNGPDSVSDGKFSGFSDSGGPYFTAFFDVAEYEDTGEIVCVWGVNKISWPTGYLLQSVEGNDRIFGSGFSRDGGASWATRSQSSGSNTATSDIPGFTDAYDNSAFLAGSLEVLPSGRLVAPVITRQAVYSLVSDDRGATWRGTKIHEYVDAWRLDGLRKYFTENQTQLGIDYSGWMWASCDTTKTRDGTTLLAITLPDDSFFFDITSVHGALPPLAGNSVSERTGFHGQSVYVYATSDGEAYGEPARITNWGCSETAYYDTANDPNNLQPDTTYAPSHQYYSDRNPGGSSVGITMRPDGFVQVYLAAHNWGDGVTLDAVASRTFSVRDLTGGESSEEQLPLFWNQGINRVYTPQRGASSTGRSYGMHMAHVQFGREQGTGWLGSVTPNISLNIYGATFPLKFDYNASNVETEFPTVLFESDGDPAGDPSQQIPEPDFRVDGAAYIVSAAPAAAGPFVGQPYTIAVWDGALAAFFFYSASFGDAVYVESPSVITAATVEAGVRYFGGGAPGTWIPADIGVTGQTDNYPDYTVFINGTHCVAAAMWRGEVVVSTAYIDMQHYMMKLPEEFPDPDAGSGDTYIPNTDSTDISAITIHRTSYWQPLRENLPCSIGLWQLSETNELDSYWFPTANNIARGVGITVPMSCGGFASVTTGYEGTTQLIEKTTLVGRAYTLCWDAQTTPEIGNNYLAIAAAGGSANLYDRGSGGVFATEYALQGGCLRVRSPFEYKADTFANSNCEIGGAQATVNFSGVSAGLTSCVRLVLAPEVNVGFSEDQGGAFDPYLTGVEPLIFAELTLAKRRISDATYDYTKWQLQFQRQNGRLGVLLLDRNALTPVVNHPVWVNMPPDSYEGEFLKWLEVVISTQEVETSDDPYSPSLLSYVSAYVRVWDRTGDPDWTQSFETLAFNATLTVLNGTEKDEFSWGGRKMSPTGFNSACSWKSVQLLRSDTDPTLAGLNILTAPDVGTAAPESILTKGALGSAIFEEESDLLDGTDAAGNLIYSAGYSVPGTCDPATFVLDDDTNVFPIGVPYFSNTYAGILGDNDSGLINALRTSQMTANPSQWVERGAHVRWFGEALAQAAFSYLSSFDFAAKNALGGPTAKEWRSTDGENYDSTVSDGDDRNDRFTNDEVVILMDAFGEHGYATDGDYQQNIILGRSMGAKFRPTGIAVFGRNWGSCTLELSDETDFPTAKTYKVTFGLPHDVFASEGGGYNAAPVAGEPNKYTHLWGYSSADQDPADVSPTRYPILGPYTFSYSGYPVPGSQASVDVAAQTDADKAPFRPGQFKSQANGPRFFLQIVDERLLDPTSSTSRQCSRAKYVYRIVDNDATTLYLDANPLDHLPPNPSAPDGGGLGWRTAIVFTDRFGTQLNYTGDDITDRHGDYRGQGYRYARITIHGCTHFSEDDKFLRAGRIVLGELLDLTAPDFQWGWGISQETGTNVLTTSGGPRYAKNRHAPRRVFQVEHAQLLPPDEPIEGDPLQPLRGFGGTVPAGRYENKRSWAEVVDMIRRMNVENQECALFWEGELALDEVPVPLVRDNSPRTDGLSLADPMNLLMVRLMSVGQATHDGFICKPVVKGDGSQLAPRPLMSIKSLTFEEEF